MEIFSSIIIFLSLILAFLCGFCFIKLFIAGRRRRYFSMFKIDNGNEFNTQDKQSQKNNKWFAWFFRNGINAFKPISKWLLKRSKYIRALFENIVSLLISSGYIADKISVMSSVICFMLIAAVLISIVFRSVFAGLAVVLCCCICVVSAVNSATEKKTQKLRSAIPDVLRSMSSCFQAGYTLLQTFEHIEQESKKAIKKLFGRCTHILQTGGTVSDSLVCLKEEKSTPELSFIAVALDVQHQTGGSMKPVIESARDMVENRLELLRLLQVQTAQAKFSARIVTILPFALIAVFSIISPNFLAPFFSSFLGVLIFGVACIMQVAGVLMVRKMLKVEI